MKILQSVFRIYVGHEDIEKAVSFYERLQNQRCERRVYIAETGVTAAKVGGFLIFAGGDEVLAPVRHVTRTSFTSIRSTNSSGGYRRTAQSFCTRRGPSPPAGT